MQYMLLIYQSDAEYGKLSDAEKEQSLRSMGSLSGALHPPGS